VLDRPKLMYEVEALADRIFLDLKGERDIARAVWEKISNDPTFKYKVRSISTPWLIPSWQGNLSDKHYVEKRLDKYSVISVDGSQVYPDKHQGTSCYLINIGTVELNYGVSGKHVKLSSIPSVYSGDDYEDFNEDVDLVNCRRQELEFYYGYDLINSGNFEDPLVFLFDGSLIFWHLESKDQKVKNFFLEKYLYALQKFYEKKVMIAGYISLPKSKELLNLIRVDLCNFEVKDSDAYKVVDHLVDASITRFFLKPFTRTTIFKNFSQITKYYPEHLHPHFFYLDIGDEIIRIEIPAWIALDNQKIATLCKVIVDQSIKGRGYPVALAEAHELAVVKGPDREFFFHLINRVGIKKNLHLTISQKVRKKNGNRGLTEGYPINFLKKLDIPPSSSEGAPISLEYS